MKTLKTISGIEIKVIPNQRKKIFTLVKNGIKYKTLQFSKEEFKNAEYWTGNDWNNFFKNGDYAIVNSTKKNNKISNLLK